MVYICAYNMVSRRNFLVFLGFFCRYLNGKDSLFREDSQNIENSGKSFGRAASLPVLKNKLKQETVSVNFFLDISNKKKVKIGKF